MVGMTALEAPPFLYAVVFPTTLYGSVSANLKCLSLMEFNTAYIYTNRMAGKSAIE
jgi:hypothetical protein